MTATARTQVGASQIVLDPTPERGSSDVNLIEPLGRGAVRRRRAGEPIGQTVAVDCRQAADVLPGIGRFPPLHVMVPGYDEQPLGINFHALEDFAEPRSGLGILFGQSPVSRVAREANQVDRAAEGDLIEDVREIGFQHAAAARGANADFGLPILAHPRQCDPLVKVGKMQDSQMMRCHSVPRGRTCLASLTLPPFILQSPRSRPFRDRPGRCPRCSAVRSAAAGRRLPQPRAGRLRIRQPCQQQRNRDGSRFRWSSRFIVSAAKVMRIGTLTRISHHAASAKPPDLS